MTISPTSAMIATPTTVTIIALIVTTRMTDTVMLITCVKHAVALATKAALALLVIATVGLSTATHQTLVTAC